MSAGFSITSPQCWRDERRDETEYVVVHWGSDSQRATIGDDVGAAPHGRSRHTAGASSPAVVPSCIKVPASSPPVIVDVVGAGAARMALRSVHGVKEAIPMMGWMTLLRLAARIRLPATVNRTGCMVACTSSHGPRHYGWWNGITVR